MKKAAVLLAVLLLAGLAGAKGYGMHSYQSQSSQSENYQSSYQKSSSNGSSSYQVQLSSVSRSCAEGSQNDSVTGDVLTKESFPPQHQARLNGTIITSNPCATLDYNVSGQNGSYTLNIVSSPGDRPCTGCVGAINYKANFMSVGENFNLTVKHNGQTVETFSAGQPANQSEMNMTNGSNTTNMSNISNMTAGNESGNITDNNSSAMKNLSALLGTNFTQMEESINTSGQNGTGLNTSNQSNNTAQNGTNFSNGSNLSNNSANMNQAYQEPNFSEQGFNSNQPSQNSEELNGTGFETNSNGPNTNYSDLERSGPPNVVEWLIMQIIMAIDLDI